MDYLRVSRDRLYVKEAIGIYVVVEEGLDILEEGRRWSFIYYEVIHQSYDRV